METGFPQRGRGHVTREFDEERTPPEPQDKAARSRNDTLSAGSYPASHAATDPSKRLDIPRPASYSDRGKAGVLKKGLLSKPPVTTGVTNYGIKR